MGQIFYDGAPFIIIPKIWINKQGEEKRFLKDFQIDIFRDDRYLSESAVRIQKYAYLKVIPEIVQANIIVHRWDEFPDRNSTVFHFKDSRRTFHMIVDDMGILHHVNLYKNQSELLEAFYNNQGQGAIQLLQQDRSKFICIARGRKRLIEVKERKSKSNSKENQQVRQLFQPIEHELRKSQIEKGQQIIEERLSDQDSQRNRGQKKEKQQDNKEIVASVWFIQNQGNRLIEEISEIDRALSLAQTVDDKDVDILPKEIFPEGIIRFVEQFGAGNYLKLFLKLNYEYLISPTRKTREAYFKDRAFEWEGIRKEIIKDFKFQKQTEQLPIEQLVIGCYGFLDAFYDSSEIIVYAKAENLNEFVVMELRLYHLGDGLISRRDQEDIGQGEQDPQRIWISEALNRLIHDLPILCQGVGQSRNIQTLLLSKCRPYYKEGTPSMTYYSTSNIIIIIIIQNLKLSVANTLYGNTMIPLYDTLGLESIPYILDHTQITTLFISSSIVDTLLKVQEYHALKNVVTFDELPQDKIQKFSDKGIKVLKYEEVLNAGKEKILPFAEVHGNDIFTFSYTSGTTGMPKGVMLRHVNFVTVAGGVVYQGIQLYPNDVYLSYLPLPHVLERVVVTALLGFGCTICMYGGDVQKINVDIQLVKPTIFVSVPRLYRRLYNTIKEKADKLTGYQKTLFEKGLASKMYYLQNGGHVQHKVWDNLVFKKTREAFGGRIRLMLSGSAPMSPEVVDFLKCVVCVPFLEGYGQTEGCGGSFISRADDPISGHVGGVFSNIEFKVIDVPQMNYFSTDKDEQGRPTPRGEICIRGNGLFAGYYKEPEKTKEMIDADGWMHSGDIGLIRPDGSLRIIDRVKNIFKLSQGEYIAPEKVEGVYLKVKGIAEVFVYGDSTKSFCVAIIVPEKHHVLELANTQGIQGTFEELCGNDKVNKYFFDEMIKYGKTEKLNGMENVKKIYIEPTSFIVHGLTSNTLKLMRHKAREHFLKQIEAMYKGSE